MGLILVINPDNVILLFRFINKNSSLEAINMADILVASANPLTPIANGKDKFNIIFMSTPKVAFLAGVLVSFKE